MGGSSWNPIRDVLETAGSLTGNYLLPGSSLVTDRIVSKGSQNQLNSPIGKVAQIGTGLTGSGIGSGTTGIPSASDIGAGWTNAANGVGNLVGAGDVGTDIQSGLQNVGTKISNGFSSLFGSGATPASGLTNAGTSTPDLTSGIKGFNPDLSASVGAPGSAGFSGASGIGGAGAASTALSGASNGISGYGGLGAALLGGANSLYANDQAQKALEDAQKKSLGQLSPYLASGASANARLSDLLGTSGNSGASGYGSLTAPFTATDLQNDPGYQFQLQQGNQALDRKQAASGNYFSGSALKAAQDYGQGLADSTLNQAFARDQAQKQQTYGMYAGQSGAGQTAATNAGNDITNLGSAKANAGIASSNTINGLLSSILSGSGAKRAINVGGQIIYV